jgi:hypothetical protein
MAWTSDVRASRVTLYRGSCHCGAIRYEVELDSGAWGRGGSVWERTVMPSAFRLTAGHDYLSGHQFANEDAHHFFCECCGVRSFSRHGGSSSFAYYSVDLKSLEHAGSSLIVARDRLLPRSSC